MLNRWTICERVEVMDWLIGYILRIVKPETESDDSTLVQH